MRAKRLISLIVLAAAVGLAYSARRRRGEPARRAVPAGADLGTTPDELDPTALGGVDDESEPFVVTAAEPELPDVDLAFEEGETWLEHLEATSAEMGPGPGRPLDMRDESERGRGRHKAATSDIPVADRGSGGPRGL